MTSKFCPGPTSLGLGSLSTLQVSAGYFLFRHSKLGPLQSFQEGPKARPQKNFTRHMFSEDVQKWCCFVHFWHIQIIFNSFNNTWKNRGFDDFSYFPFSKKTSSSFGSGTEWRQTPGLNSWRGGTTKEVLLDHQSNWLDGKRTGWIHQLPTLVIHLAINKRKPCPESERLSEIFLLDICLLLWSYKLRHTMSTRGLNLTNAGSGSFEAWPCRTVQLPSDFYHPQTNMPWQTVVLETIS